MATAFFPYTTPSVPSDVGATASIKIGAEKRLTLAIPAKADRLVVHVNAGCRLAAAAGAVPVVDIVVENEFANGVDVPANTDAVFTLTPGDDRLLAIVGPENTTGTIIAYGGEVVPRPWVVASSYGLAPTAGAGNWGSGATGRAFLTRGNRFRIRQKGIVRRVRFGVSATGNITGFFIQVWRKNAGGTYDFVGASENLASRLVAGTVNNLELYSPFAVQPGDYVGYEVVTTGTVDFASVLTGRTDVDTHYLAGPATSQTAFNWEGQTKAAGVGLPIEVSIASPKIVGIGDSIMVGHASNWAMTESTTPANIRTNLAASLVDLVAAPRGWAAQNMGIGGQTTAEISARFAADAVALAPDYVLINGGVNDISDGNVTKNQFLANWKSMLDQSVAANIRPIAMKILPWTAGTNAQHVIREDWNAALAALVATYPAAILIDASAVVGQFRAGGPAGNLWDIQPALTADNVHFTVAAYAAMWPLISAALPAF